MGINNTYPAPQADRLDKVAVVVDAIHAGADTAPAVAATLRVVDRQGSYYANAAAYLGLAKVDTSTTPARYILTDQGLSYHSADHQQRTALLTAAVIEVPAVQIWKASGMQAATDFYINCGLDRDTAERRAKTAATWAQTIAAPLTAADIAREAAHVLATAPTVVAATKKAQKPALRKAALCGSCFLEMPANNECQFC